MLEGSAQAKHINTNYDQTNDYNAEVDNYSLLSSWLRTSLFFFPCRAQNERLFRCQNYKRLKCIPQKNGTSICSEFYVLFRND